MNRDLLLKPGILNFLILLAFWYAGISFYILAASIPATIGELYIFYTKYSWPNFAIAYLLFIYAIPHYLGRKQYARLGLATIVTIIVFVGIRYLNNSFWSPDYYLTEIVKNEYHRDSLMSIITGEAVRMLEFTAIAYALRLLAERRTDEINRSIAEKEHLKAELQSLRHQISPHFLLNAMNNIYFLALMRSGETPDAVMKLSEMLRYMLYEKSERVTLKSELGYISSYLDFHRIRWPEDEVQMEVTVRQEDQEELVPPQVFITFLENAFKHGKIGTVEDPTRVRIGISGRTLGYRVTNQIAETPRDVIEGGNGLSTLKKRLALFYNDRATVSTRQSGNHYIAELTLPLNS